MNIIALVKQVPDVSNIPEDAWDREKGTLRRAALDTVSNPLDLQALTFACRLKDKFPGSRVLCLTMGPPQARAMLEDALSRGADEAVLLTDDKFAGADTPATAYALALAVRRIASEIFKSGDYVLVAGMQSVDGDTAQVPPQVAEDLGVEHIAYVNGFEAAADGTLRVTRIGPEGLETIVPLKTPFLATLVNCLPAANRSFFRAREARTEPGRVLTWNAQDVGAAPDRVGLKGSRTWVVRIFSSANERANPCVYPKSVDELLDLLEKAYRRGPSAGAAAKAVYAAGGKKPSYSGEVWVYAEVRDGALAGVSLELLSKARELAAPFGAKVASVLLGEKVAGLAPRLIAAGADKVYVAEHPLLKEFLPIPFKKAMAALIISRRPQIVLFGATPLGRELAPRIAYAVGAGLTADCTGLEIGDHALGKAAYTAGLKQTRPALGGNIMATIMTKDSPFQMATVRPGVFPALPPDQSRSGEVIREVPDLDAADIRSRIAAREKVTHHVHLERARIIVSGGRGIGSRPEVEKSLKPLSEALACWLKDPAEVAGSRMAVEDGFIGHERQVGQTGQTVAPGLYVAVGISGAVQHITGMQNSSVIVAINRDPGARIFRYADFGLIGAFNEIVPRLTEAVRRRCA